MGTLSYSSAQTVVNVAAARQRDPLLCRFTTPDPLAAKFPSLSPYSMLAANPVNLVDPSGEAWEPIKNGCELVGFGWVDSKLSYGDDGKLHPGLYEQAILFTSLGAEGQTFDPDSDFNMGTSTAIVYKEDGSTEEYEACTYPSDLEAYPTIPPGLYEAQVGKHNNQYAALRMSDVGTKNFSNSSIELGQPNPAAKDRTTAVGINIHKDGVNNLTGKTTQNKPVSAGCFLINNKQWNSFMSNFKNTKQVIGVGVQR